MHKNQYTRAPLSNAMSLAVIEAVERRLLMSTYTVNTTSDAVNPGTGLLTLRQAVADANAHVGADTIAFDSKVFAPGSLHTITLTLGQIVFTDTSGATTVNGPGQTVLAVDANHHSRVFKVSSGVTVNLNGLTAANGSFTAPTGLVAAGGGVLDNGKLFLTRVTVSNSNATGGSETGFTSVNGGAAQGGGIYSNGTLSLVESTVSGNVAQGGSAYESGTSGGVAQGAGIFSSGSLTVFESTITGNTAVGGFPSGGYGNLGGAAEGGGIFTSGFWSVNADTFSVNAADGGQHPGYPGNGASGGMAAGGAIYATDAASLNGDTFLANQATGGSSGPLAGTGGQARGGAILGTAALTVTNAYFGGNGVSGGAGPWDDNGPGAAAFGGAIDADASLSVSNSTITGSSAVGGLGNPEGTPSAGGYGGGIYSAQSLSISNSTLSGNLAEGGGGGIYGGIGGAAQGGGVDAGGTATITGTTLINNAVLGGVGGNSDGTYPANVGGTAEGGAIFNSATLKLINSTIAHNFATGGTGGKGEYNGGGVPAGDGADGADGTGSAIYSVNTLAVSDSTITGNTTDGGAGGIAYNGYPAGNPGTGRAAVTIAGGSAVFNNTIVSANAPFNAPEEDIDGTLASSSGFNLIGAGGGLTNGVNGNKVGIDDPKLLPLDWYGGPTQTMLPMPNSPVIDAGSNGLIPSGVTIDQRGYPRISGKSVDIGSVEFGNVVITGTVFNDQNADGKRQTGEPGLAGFVVYVDLNHDGIMDSSDYETQTNSAGQYTFIGLPPGTYAVGISSAKNYRPTTATLENVNASSGGMVTAAPFGQTQDALISGSVINATTHAALSGFRVYLDLNKDGKWESTETSYVTSSSGTWSFNIATPGTYQVRIVPMSGYKTTAPSGGLFTFTVGKASARIGNVFAEQLIA